MPALTVISSSLPAFSHATFTLTGMSRMRCQQRLKLALERAPLSTTTTLTPRPLCQSASNGTGKGVHVRSMHMYVRMFYGG